jgi:hypothetical protein
MTSEPIQQSRDDVWRIAAALGGLLLLPLSIWFVQGIIAAWQTTSLWSSVPTLVMGIAYGSASIAMLLAPLYRIRLVKHVALFFLWPLQLFVRLGYYYVLVAAPVLTFLYQVAF